jgi:hypothetical protein
MFRVLVGHRYTLKPDYIFGVEQREEDTRSLQFDALAAEHGVITCYHGTVGLQLSACFSKLLAPWPCSCTDSFGGADDPINPLPSAAFLDVDSSPGSRELSINLDERLSEPF